LYAHHYLVDAFFLVIPIYIINPVFEYTMAKRQKKIYQQAPLLLQKILLSPHSSALLPIDFLFIEEDRFDRGRKYCR
jgi:hypothetical protein